MPSTRTWLGTDVNNPGDWNTAANWSGATVPIAGDTVQFYSGSQDVTSGLDQAAVALANFRQSEGYGGKIGGPSTSLLLNCTTLASIRTQCEQYISFQASTDRVKIRSNPSRPLYLTGPADLVVIERGKVDWAAGTVAQMILAYLSQPLTDAELIAHTPTLTLLRMHGGTALMDAAGTITTAVTKTGSLTVEEGLLTNCYMYGGNVYWLTDDTLADLDVFGGTFDASGDARAKAITALEMHHGSYVNLDNGCENITVNSNIVRRGGVLIPETVRSLAYA